MRTCIRCEQPKILDEFYKDYTTGGRVRKHAICKVCYRTEQKSRPRNVANSRAWANTVRDDRMQWLNELRSVPCMDCGRTFPPCCMDFDHRPGEIKSFDIANNVKRSKESLLVEIAKCDLVCSNCHRIRTHARLQAKLKAARKQP